jgi:hypothetical protein
MEYLSNFGKIEFRFLVVIIAYIIFGNLLSLIVMSRSEYLNYLKLSLSYFRLYFLICSVFAIFGAMDGK